MKYKFLNAIAIIFKTFGLISKKDYEYYKINEVFLK